MFQNLLSQLRLLFSSDISSEDCECKTEFHGITVYDLVDFIIDNKGFPQKKFLDEFQCGASRWIKIKDWLWKKRIIEKRHNRLTFPFQEGELSYVIWGRLEDEGILE